MNQNISYSTIAAAYSDLPNPLQPSSTLPALGWTPIRCDHMHCPDAVAFSTVLNSSMVLQYEWNGGMDRTPLDDFTNYIQMYQRPALYL